MQVSEKLRRMLSVSISPNVRPPDKVNLQSFPTLDVHAHRDAPFLVFQKDLNITVNADETLDSFCKWQMGLNHPEDSHPNHHDVAILVTRYVCQGSLLSVCKKQVPYSHTIHKFNM